MAGGRCRNICISSCCWAGNGAASRRYPYPYFFEAGMLIALKEVFNEAPDDREDLAA